MRKLFLLLRYAYLVLIAILLFCSLAFAVLQTKWAKEKIAIAFSSFCAEKGIQVKLGHVEGSLPFTWHVDRIALKWGTDESLELHDIKMRFAILPLINKNVVLSYFNVEQAQFSFHSTLLSHNITLEEIKLKAKEIAGQLSIPYRIVIQRLKINSFICENFSANKAALYFLVADADLGKYMRHFYGNISLSPRGHPDNVLQLNAEANQKLNSASFGIKAHLSSLEPLKPFYSFQSEEKIDLDLLLKGKWTAWSAFFNDEPMASSLWGLCKADVHPQSQLALFNRLWTIDADFAIDTIHSLSMHSCLLQSDMIEAEMRGKIVKDLEQSTAHLSFTLPDLSVFDHAFLKGNASGDVSYANRCGILDLRAEHLECKGYLLEPLEAHIQGHLTENGWQGHGNMATIGENLKLQSAFDLQYEADQFSLNGFSLEGPGMVLAGDLSLDIQRILYTGALYGHIDHLHPFAFLFDKDSLDANIGIECQLSEDRGKQNLRCCILGTNFLFNHYAIEKFSLTASVSDLFYQPLGKIHLIAEELHSPHFDIDTVDLTTASEEDEEWPFYLQIEGTAEVPFSLYAQGKWEKEKSLFTVETTALSGKLFSYPIDLQEPCVFEKGARFASLSPVHMTIGEASLFAACDLNESRSTAQIELQHFPLKLFSLFYPTHALRGELFLNGNIDATADNIQGALNAILDEVQFQQIDKTEPFIAKGSMQTHIDHAILQTHAYLSATRNQFIDFAATLPLSYSVYPFHLALDTQKPVSSELIAEGQLQDLFDFINLGIHRTSGFVSSRLFLSHTLSSPAMQGSIEWQGGTYENFLTGTSLKDIHAELQADSKELHLVSFSAKDDKKGTVQAEGSIDLNLQAHFPFKFIAELDNLHTVHFNPIDCSLTGPLYISGNLKEAFAQGNLLVPQAEFKIPDRLHFEVPVLPVTYVHSPHPLSSAALLPSPAFPFRINLELTAEDHVQVTGKGLNSEWKGTLLLNGTNMNVLPNGTLQLVKGDYAFFGKTFKLNEGQIIFNDKPTPGATINLSGILSLADTVITAQLRGPLSSPTLTFQSNPQLSTSAILARILFNKDISDISQPEAIQLATTLISLSGGAGPSVLEAIRKNIGVDRLAIASQTANPDEIAVQIGKYLTKGVLITLSQSATSSQIIVEVEFKHGFVFQAETQEEQEGKFSLKWTHSY